MAIYTGQSNTLAIIENCKEPDIAALLCLNSKNQGQDDWVLPSRDELAKMYNLKDMIDSVAVLNGGTVFEEMQYWSSSDDGEIDAWNQNLGTGGQLTNFKEGNGYVRAFRYF